MKLKKKAKATTVIGILLLISLVLSAIYSAVRLCIAPSEINPGEEYRKIKSDYLLMLTQCLLGLIVMMIPTLVKHKLRVVVPNTIVILYYVFLYCAIYLGEIRNFYYLIPHWDTVLHAFSGAMLGALGFVLVDLLNKDQSISVKLSPFFVSLFAFCFALAFGALWEIYEYTFDWVLGLNMQKHSTETGEALAGALALSDTMKDLIFDAAAALAVSVIGYFTNLKNISFKRLGEKKTDADSAGAEENA